MLILKLLLWLALFCLGVALIAAMMDNLILALIATYPLFWIGMWVCAGIEWVNRQLRNKEDD